MSMPQERTWWQRNWKWVVPAGCLTPLVICGGGFMAILAIVFGAMKASDPYQEAVSRAKANTAVQAALGSPIEEGYFPSGSIRTHVDNGQGSGEADLTIPVSGPKGSGTVRVEATKADGKWSYQVLQIDIDGQNEPIDLLPGDLLPGESP